MSKLINFYDLKEAKEMREASHNPHFDKNDTDLPARVCIVGASGSGKTTSLLNFLLISPNTFGWITIVTKQSVPLYEFLDKKLKSKGIRVFAFLPFYGWFSRYPAISAVDCFSRHGTHTVSPYNQP